MAEQQAPAAKPAAGEFKEFTRKNGTTARIKKKAPGEAPAAKPAEPKPAEAKPSRGWWGVAGAVLAGTLGGVLLLAAVSAAARSGQVQQQAA
jgi:uncharacterized protein involved in exopolysaccharide biosynthesis